MTRHTKPETTLTEAADKATALIQGLQLRLNREAVVRRRDETPEDLDRQLREYFLAESGKLTSDGGLLDQIRERVIDAVADRILQSWERGDRGKLSALESQVIERVAERILERMARR